VSVQDHASSSMNESGTCQKIGTPLTQLGSPNVHRELLVKRNLAEQSKWLNDPDPRPWATHPMQSVRVMMKWQIDLLAK
jgi:hypothetical protein